MNTPKTLEYLTEELKKYKFDEEIASSSCWYWRDIAIEYIRKEKGEEAVEQAIKKAMTDGFLA